MKEKSVLLFVCGVVLFFLPGCYYLNQGSTLLKYHCAAVSNKTLLADTATPADVKKFLSAVEDIRGFAVDKIGLNKNKNFSSFVKVDRDYLVDNVYAARADTFAQYFWRYPILGAMPYKGFFSKSDAEKEAASIGKKGFDVHIAEINGFSTLGILRDPAYSFMKRYGPYSLSSLLFHELTHATIFIKNQPSFNEDLPKLFSGPPGSRHPPSPRVASSRVMMIIIAR